MSSKKKRQKARELHRQNKHRARYKRILEKYRGDRSWADYSEEAFNQMIRELSALNVKYLQQLLSDLKSQATTPFNRKEHLKLQSAVESSILEKVVLK